MITGFPLKKTKTTVLAFQVQHRLRHLLQVLQGLQAQPEQPCRHLLQVLQALLVRPDRRQLALGSVRLA